MTDIVYVYGGKVYLNLTNRCPCNCTFCIRKNGEGLGSAETLWHHGDPTTEQVLAALRAFDFTPYDEITFCGYGEPTCALDALTAAAGYLRETYPKTRLRVNTNGLGDLINGHPTAQTLVSCVDVISISLNAPTAEKYVAVTRPSFGAAAFDAMLTFADECRRLGAQVIFTVVDVISPEDIEAARALAQAHRIPLRVREYTDE